MRLSLKTLETWNRKLHYYSGLYLLLFIWLFAVSGLLLNHSQWTVANFWPQRQQERFERPVQLAAGASDTDQARSLMRQLGIAGEIEWTAPRQPAEQFEFRAARPGRMASVSVNVSTGVASVEQISVNGWGILNALHSFTGVRGGRPEVTRDWWLTWLWIPERSWTAASVWAGTVRSFSGEICLATSEGGWPLGVRVGRP
jgi:hypothetical protein